MATIQPFLFAVVTTQLTFCCVSLQELTKPEVQVAALLHTNAIWKAMTLKQAQSKARQLDVCGWLDSPHCPVSKAEFRTSRGSGMDTEGFKQFLMKAVGYD